jgi:hypothetical protein
MSETLKRSGRCLCGAVTITAEASSNHVGACHCQMCRRWGGGPLMAIDCGTSLTLEGEAFVKVYPSSLWAERGFCQQCGTHLFYRLKKSGEWIVPAGLLSNEGSLVFDHQIFTEEKPDYYRFANQTREMTGAEVFASYAPPAEE